jgi:hypothetical protein
MPPCCIFAVVIVLLLLPLLLLLTVLVVVVVVVNTFCVCMRVLITSNGCKVAEETRPAVAPPMKEEEFHPEENDVDDGESVFDVDDVFTVAVVLLSSFIVDCDPIFE